MTRRGVLLLLLLASVLLATAGVGVAGYVRLVTPSIELPGDFRSQVLQPGAITADYALSAARVWLYDYYDWSVLNYLNRSRHAVMTAGPELQPQLDTFLRSQWEIIEAGQQTQSAIVSVETPRHTGNQWSVAFTVEAEPWIGAVRAPKRHIRGTLWLSYAGPRAGAVSLLQVDALHVESDVSDVVPVSPAVTGKASS